MPTIFRYLLLALGLFISFPLLVLLSLLPKTPVTTLGVIYLLSCSLIVLGMIFAPWNPHYSSVFILTGIAITFLTVTSRILFPPSGTFLNLITLPGQSGPRVLNRILDEQDAVLFGAQLAPYLGAISSTEKKSLDRTFAQAFLEMKAQGVTPLSPFLATYLNQQRASEFDLLVAAPGSEVPPRAGIIFLHGFGGNFTVQCWLMSSAGDQIGAITVCPSTSPSGAWWDSEGQAILQETFNYLHERGVERIYLAGLSNGAIGASRLAGQLEDDVRGLILISGTDPGATMTQLPVLLLHGKNDARIPASVMEQYASAAGQKADYHLFEGDHFLLLKQADSVQTVIAEWLREQEFKSTNEDRDAQ